MALNERDFSQVMAAPKDQRHNLVGDTFAHMPILSPLLSLPPILVAETLAQKIKDSELENLEPEHVYILESILESPFEQGDEERWLSVLTELELHVYVALADDEICKNIVDVLYKWITNLDDQAFSTFETFKKSLKLIYNPQQQTPPDCQDAALVLLNRLRESGDKFRVAVDEMLFSLKSEMQGTMLETLINNISG